MIFRYVLVDAAGVEREGEYRRLQDAIDAGRSIGHAIRRREYVIVSSDLVWTPDGSDTWPPPRKEPTL